MDHLHAELAHAHAELGELRSFECEPNQVKNQANLIGALDNCGKHKKLAQLLDKLIEGIVVRAD